MWGTGQRRRGAQVALTLTALTLTALTTLVVSGCNDPTWVRIHLDAQDQSCRDATHLTLFARNHADGEPITVSDIPLSGGCRGEGQLPGNIVFVPGASGVGERFSFEGVLSRGEPGGIDEPFNWVRLEVDFQEHSGRDLLLCFEDKCRGRACEASGCAGGAGEDGGADGSCEVCFAGSCAPAEARVVALSGTTCPGCLADEVPFEESCHDGIDNDCDGLPDCTDSDCTHFSDGVRRTEDPTLECDNGIDDDCDGLTDLADCDCRPIEQQCADLIDNDCDGIIDCQDPDCAGQLCGAGGLACDPTDGMCRCVRGTDVEICHNRLDDNCNGEVDCAEASCRFGSETNCGDHVDDDCDGLMDCLDPDCLQQPCMPGLSQAQAVCCNDGMCQPLDANGRCGGCNIACQAGNDCRPVRDSGVSSPGVGYACVCVRDGQCPNGQSCLDRSDTPGLRCNCTADDQCAFGQRCRMRGGGLNNYCTY